MLRVAVKFCGGCNPDYERVEYFERIKAAAGDQVEWVGLDDVGFDRLLVISGCPTACPAEHLRAAGRSRFTDINHAGRSPEAVVAALAGGHYDQDQG